MCLALPGKIEEISENNGLKMAKVNFGGIRKSVCLEYVPNASIADYVLVHVGFALSIINEEEAKRNSQMLLVNESLQEIKAIESEIMDNK